MFVENGDFSGAVRLMNELKTFYDGAEEVTAATQEQATLINDIEGISEELATQANRLKQTIEKNLSSKNEIEPNKSKVESKQNLEKKGIKNRVMS